MHIFRVLNANECKELIPDVLDALLDFHTHLLRRVKKRLDAEPLVSTISDIVLEEFKSGVHRASAINAYTHFTLAKSDAEARYNELLKRNSPFRQFCEARRVGIMMRNIIKLYILESRTQSSIQGEILYQSTFTFDSLAFCFN